MKHEFKVGDLWRVKTGIDLGSTSRLGFIYKIREGGDVIWVMMNDTECYGWSLHDFNSYFERATKTK